MIYPGWLLHGGKVRESVSGRGKTISGETRGRVWGTMSKHWRRSRRKEAVLCKAVLSVHWQGRDRTVGVCWC